MSRLFKGFTLNEGYTDLGTLSADITFVEAGGERQTNNVRPPANQYPILFQLVNDDPGDPLPGLEINIQVDAPKGTDATISAKQNSNTQGYAQFLLPQICTYPIELGSNPEMINFEIEGELTSREQECYIEVRDPGDDPLYTLLRQFAIYYDDELDQTILGIPVSSGKTPVIYPVYPAIELSSDILSVFISGTGQVYEFTDGTQEWTYVDTFQFSQFANPAGLEAVDPWFYETSGTSGTITTGELGVDTFEDFSFKGLNPSPAFIDIAVSIPNPEGGSPLYSDTIQIKPGEDKINIFELDYSPAVPDDDTPTIANVATAAGITFSGPFLTFLSANDLDTVQAIRRAGPLKYMTGIPDPDASEVALLQSYVDLYFLVYDLNGCTAIRTAGYNSVYDIASVPRNVFIADMDTDPAFTFSLARTHELAVQRVALISNVLSASLNDIQLQEKINYAGDNPKAYELFKPNCGCDDCKSGISPFAYLNDLVKYSAAHLIKTGEYEPGAPINYSDFLTLLEATFYQPFGSYPVDCEMLHHEFCRVRLATEVLVKLKDFMWSGISDGRKNTFYIERKQYLQLTYNTLLLKMGTSFDEVRSVFLTTPDEVKEPLARKLAAKLGIPYYIPGSTTLLTTDVLWLPLSNDPMDYDDYEDSLQSVFGFRSTRENVLVFPPESDMETWRKAYLKDAWISQDFSLSAYTREDVDPSSLTIQDQWQPIVDPDIIGLSDIRYFAQADVIGVYSHRKADIDAFLDYYVKDTDTIGFLTRTNADMLNQIVRTTEDVAGDVVDGNIVQIETASSVWDDFDLVSRTVNGTNVDFQLAFISDPFVQPYGTSPTMKYNRVQNILSYIATSGTVLTVILPYSAADYLASGYVKLISTVPGQTNEYSTDAVSDHFKIISINVSGGTTVAITFHADVEYPDSTYLAGIQLIYEKEVDLFTDEISDPADTVTNLFASGSQHYTPYGGGTDIDYDVWISSGFTPGTDYAGLKILYQEILNGDNTHLSLIDTKLHLTQLQFIRMMQLFILCENYLAAMYTNPRPTTAQLYELASYFRISSRTPLRTIWIEEEIKYGSPDLNLHLTYQNFWKSLTEPMPGVWDPTLQTIPDVRPMIDPEFTTVNDILDGPFGEDYRDLLLARMEILEDEKNNYMNLLNPYGTDRFTPILNRINKGSLVIAYEIPAPYDTLEGLVTAVKSINPFTSRDATQAMYETFGMTKTEFLRFISIKDKYETFGYLINAANLAELSVAADIGVLGYKRHWLWLNAGTTWIEAEAGFNYYEIFKMKLDPVRGNIETRLSWQLTLEKWNQLPIIDPDIVPAENIVGFIATDPAYIFWNDRSVDYSTKIGAFAGILDPGDDAGDQLAALSGLICNIIYQETSPGVTALPFFLGLKDLEEAGENIVPQVTQLNLSMAGYRMIRKTYDMLDALSPSAPSPLIDSEYEDLYDIFLQTYKENILFYTYRVEEYQGALIPSETPPYVLLSGEQFRIYQPPINTFPLTDLPVYNTWRSPFISRRNWLDTLQDRLDLEKEMSNAWEKVLMDTEDITMQAMRNALIRVLANNCETFDETAERLAQSLFIETKDNCCAHHTRISQAIETLQGFIFALKNGVYDEYIDGWSLQATNFEQEWEWLGSYSAWRSAMFVFLYPENILYPTLKRHQSPAFRILSEDMTNAARLNPEAACVLAKNYEDYFFDVMNLDVKFTATCYANVYKNNADICCDEIRQNIWVTYFFAQSRLTGKNYVSVKTNDDHTDYSHTFWTEIPNVPAGCELLGAYPLARDFNGLTHNRKELWLVYSYKKDGKLIMAYVKKDLLVPNKDWTDETEMDEIPTKFQMQWEVEVDLGTPFAITACQSTIEWDHMSFIFSYNWGDNGARHLLIRYEDTDEKFSVPTPFPHVQSYTNTDSRERPVTAIRHHTGDLSINPNELYGWSIVFNKSIVTGNKTINLPFSSLRVEPFGDYDFVGAFQMRETPNGILVVLDAHGHLVVKRFLFTFANALGVAVNVTITSNNVIAPFNNIRTIFPIFSFDDGPNVYFALKNDDMWVESQLLFDDGNTQFYDLHFEAIAPVPLTDSVRIQSAHCIKDMDDRAENIKQHMLRLQVTSSFTYWPSIIKEYVYEAYYFVPMLIALDQQRRGQFESALDWYRTIYDYTKNATTNRKIFYGLVLEESVTNVFSRPSDWLLDPLNPHLIAQMRANAYTRYTVINIVQCLSGYGDREFTTDTSETVPRARILYTAALDLLQVRELNVAPNSCIAESHCFVPAITAMFKGNSWENLFNDLQDELGTITDPAVLEETHADIVEVFEDDELTVAEQFAEAFDLIAEAKAGLVTTPPTVLEVADGTGERFTVAMQFLEAPLHLGDVTSTYMQVISDNYAEAVAHISGIPAAALNTNTNNSSVLQLANADRSISSRYDFGFTDASGVQYFTGAQAYNPLMPTLVAFNSNLLYTNTNDYLNYVNPVPRPPYYPFIDYQFCIPKNPVYDSMKMKLNVELYKIFNCRNIAGMQRELDIYGAATDSTTGVPIIGAQGNLILPTLNAFKPSQYRFAVLIERAKQLVQQTSQIEAQFLSALEKRDAEYYNLMKARQDLQTSKATIKLQDMRVKQANDEKVISDIQSLKANYSYLTFSGWINEGVNGFEATSIAMLEATAVLYSIAAITDGTTAVAQAASAQSSVFAQIASYQRRQEEWIYQRQLASFDVQLSNQQIKISEDNIRIVSQEREISQMNADFANDTLEFLKNKFTNAELYNWMSNVLEGVYAYMLNLSTAVARTAEGQLYFERQEPAGPFILDDYWESPNDNYIASATGAGNTDRRGLTGSARLLQDIIRLDQFAFDTNKRKLQMSKTISLAQNFPEAFQRFRETGVLNFELTNEIFDHDFPGHYLRLINNVKTSVIGLVPVYGGIKASLTADTISYVVISGNNGATFQRVPINRMQNDMVTLTSPTNATGLFEMQPLNGELLNPFEGMGIESRWEFKMPHFSNRMDYDQIADVVITVEYTALDSFVYRQQVLAEINNELSFNRAFSFKNNFPDQWYELANVLEGVNSFEVTFKTRREDFPAGLEIQRATRLTLYFVREDGFTDEINIANFGFEHTPPLVDFTGTTVNGIFNAQTLVLSNDPLIPFQTWKLKFDNSDGQNRLLFTDEKVTDILFVITCDAELPPYV